MRTGTEQNDLIAWPPKSTVRGRAEQSIQEKERLSVYMQGLLTEHLCLLSWYVARAGLALMILLHQVPMCWDWSLSEWKKQTPQAT